MYGKNAGKRSRKIRVNNFLPQLFFPQEKMGEIKKASLHPRSEISMKNDTLGQKALQLDENDTGTFSTFKYLDTISKIANSYRQKTVQIDANYKVTPSTFKYLGT